MPKSLDLIFLSGGGTLGSVTPLLALAEDLDAKYSCHFVGTNTGVERAVVTDQGLVYHPIASGKWRRYFSWRNFFDPLLIIYAFFQSIFLLLKHHPKLIISAGSFVSVPLVAAGRLLGIKAIILQLDVLPGLANRLMACLGAQVALALPELKAQYPKADLIGCPLRSAIRASSDLDRTQARLAFDLKSDQATILVLAGGTGSVAINKLVLDNLYNLTQVCQVIHITGPAKTSVTDKNQRYRSLALTSAEQLAQAYAAADLVVSRAGMGVITELAYLHKPTMLIPLPASHQEANTRYFSDRQAALYLDQGKTTAWTFVSALKQALAHPQLLQTQGDKLHSCLPSDANHKFLNLILKALA